MNTTTTTNAPGRLLDTLRDVRDLLDTLAAMTDDDNPAARAYWPEPDAIIETMRLRFSGRVTGCRDYRTGEPVPVDPDTVTLDTPSVCPVIELPRGIAFTIRKPYISLTRESHAQIVVYCDVFRAGSRFSGSLLIPLTPEAMPGNGQTPRPYWDHYPRAHWPKPAELPPGARDAVATAIAGLLPDTLPPAAILAARIHALHKEAAGEIYAGLSKAHRELATAVSLAARHATTAGQIAGQ